MASTTRQRVKTLLDRGHTVLEVSRKLKISPQAVYKHKRILDADSQRAGASA